MNTDALIFDMDGTLWDSSDVVASAWKKVLNESGLVKTEITAEKIKQQMGKHLYDIAESFFPDIDVTKRNALMDECCDYEDKLISQVGGQLFDNLEKTLIELKKTCKLYIVSNCQDGYIEAFFKFHKLDKYFSDYQCAGKSNKTKGEVIIDLMKRNKINRAYYVGDTQLDYEATRKACIPFIYASYGFGNVTNYEYKIDNFEDLTTMF